MHRIQVRHPFIIVPVILTGCVFYSVNVVYDVREVYLLAQDLEQKRLERGNVWAVPFLLQNWHCRTSLWARPTPSTVRNTMEENIKILDLHKFLLKYDLVAIFQFKTLYAIMLKLMLQYSDPKP